MTKKIIWGLLPEDAQVMLKEAAATIVDSNSKEVVTRVRAALISDAGKIIKAKYPEYFRGESV